MFVFLLIVNLVDRGFSLWANWYWFQGSGRAGTAAAWLTGLFFLMLTAHGAVFWSFFVRARVDNREAWSQVLAVSFILLAFGFLDESYHMAEFHHVLCHDRSTDVWGARFATRLSLSLFFGVLDYSLFVATHAAEAMSAAQPIALANLADDQL